MRTSPLLVIAIPPQSALLISNPFLRAPADHRPGAAEQRQEGRRPGLLRRLLGGDLWVCVLRMLLLRMLLLALRLRAMLTGSTANFVLRNAVSLLPSPSEFPWLCPAAAGIRSRTLVRRGKVVKRTTGHRRCLPLLRRQFSGHRS